MIQFDKNTIGRQAKELGFVRDTFEKVCRLADVLKFYENDDILSRCLALKGGTAINLTIFNLPRLSVDIKQVEVSALKSKSDKHLELYTDIKEKIAERKKRKQN